MKTDPVTRSTIAAILGGPCGPPNNEAEPNMRKKPCRSLRTRLHSSSPSRRTNLSPKGVTWGLVGRSVERNNAVEHIEALFKAAKANGYDVFISPHYYYPTDQGWRFGGTVEKMMHEIHMFDRKGALTLDGFAGSGFRSKPESPFSTCSGTGIAYFPGI
jgi:hypothetical protein